MTEFDNVVSAINALGPPFAVSPPAVGHEFGDRECFAAAALADRATGQARRMVEVHAQSRRMPVGRHAGSLVFQRYCHRLCGVAVAAWVLRGAALDLRAELVTMRFTDGSPDLVLLERSVVIPGAGPEDVLASVLDGHLRPVARALSAETGPGMGNLLGNAAAGIAGAFRTLSRLGPQETDAVNLRNRAEELLSARPELWRGGELRVLDGPQGARLQYDRRSCCHWYAAPDGRFCSWCSRLTKEERTRRFVEAMAGE